MKYLIINADDFGLSPGVSEGIMEAHNNGILTSTSIMMNTSTVISDIKKMKLACPKIGTGVHLILTQGKPVLESEKVPSLIDSKGEFLKFHKHLFLKNFIKYDQVYEEWTAQIEKLLATGLEIDHLDSHHHISYSNLELFEIMLFLSNKYSIPIRRFPKFSTVSQKILNENSSVKKMINQFHPKWPDSLITGFFNKSISKNIFSKTMEYGTQIKIIQNLQNGICEIMSHPGYVDQALMNLSKYNKKREKEIEILTDKNIRQSIKKQGIKLIDFSCLK